jgi:hypothetical protein
MGSMRGGLSPKPDARQRQLANLRPNAHSTHGVYDLRRTQPLAEQHTIALRESFPQADDRLIAAQAQRSAAIDLAWAWICEHGLVRTKAGDPFGVVQLWRRLLNDSDAAHRALEQQQRAVTEDPGERLRAIGARIAREREAKARPELTPAAELDGDAEQLEADAEDGGEGDA